MFTKIVVPALLAGYPQSYAYDYGVDTSFPVHNNFLGSDASVSKTLEYFGPQKIDLYKEYINGCVEKYGPKCTQNEENRMAFNRNEPRKMTNYTDIGFKKVRLSDEMWTLLREFWDETMNNGGIEKLSEENWPVANTYKNHWASASKIEHITYLSEPIWQEVEKKVKEWIPEATSFSRSSMYGIRVYTSGSILATHVDRDPLITSAIINVGQDVDEDWPLEVYDHDGRAHNITIQPGDMILYESHSVLHGRPFPLKGKYYANIFVHFKPLFEGDEDARVEDESQVSYPQTEPYDYGVDTSFPIHHKFLGSGASFSETLKLFGSHKLKLYYEYISGCQNKYQMVNKAHECSNNEDERLALNLNQPREMTNYTDIGFKKVRLSDEIWTLLREFWDETMNNGGIENLEEEYWPEANTYTNHWASESKMKDIHALHEPIWQEAERKVKEWIPEATSFSRSSMYGIRVYTSGSILATHVDRDPLITSAIINVGQDLDEDWPLEVYGHDGRAHNITMQPGDMVLYESHSVLHGRPFPLKGKYYANIFVHFKPLFEGDESEGEL